MDSLQQRDHLDRLPTELKVSVARYVQALADRKALSLVSKIWAEVVLPFLWETFTTDLVLSGRRNLLGIAHPASNIVKHVRRIHMLSRGIVNMADEHLPTLLAAIPQGQLRSFRCVDGVPVCTLNLLLQLHPKLEELRVSNGQAFSSLLGSPWTAGCFSNLGSMDINVDGLSREGFQRLWARCTNLAHLRLTGRSVWRGASVTQSTLHEDHFLLRQDESLLKETNGTGASVQQLQLLKLSSLYIGPIALPKSFDTMFQRIDVLALQELTINGTSGVTGLVSALASEFAEGKPLLRKLRIVQLSEQSTDDFVQHLFLLLLAFHGLRQLHIQCNNCGKIDVDGIVNHGETLTDLLIVNGSVFRETKDRCMSASDLQKIAIACPHIEQLCLNLYEIDPDKAEGDVLGPHPSIPFEPTEFEEALSAIASLQNLQVLRFTNPPNYRRSYDRNGTRFRWIQRVIERGEQRYAFQARADGVMRYLGDRNSPIKLLAFSPIEKLQKPENADKNGHFWPHYFYYRGRVIDHPGTDIASARPLADWKMDFPGATVLEDL